ncbi:ribbon-helix-helix protein, CopG family [Pseudomonas sp. HR96]|uniref:CopG family ribbon-helix-helix protein n=1 Tax=Pseudomonas sp. HR96 TaxID=1027966 RepID=UPI002A7507FD|nr:ribbon-helix-helix protein, CopG family [Pseudomonas sp. HR96]WPO98436.1 ribbon-helix-helix protein, CopG family [Pseudomonas sp. HR96]
MPVMSIRLSEEMADSLAALAQATGCSKSYLAVDALQGYLDREAWQVAEITKGLGEADAGDFASPGEVAAVTGKWTGTAG